MSDSSPQPPSSRALRQRLESLQAAGVEQMPRRVGRIRIAGELAGERSMSTPGANDLTTPPAKEAPAAGVVDSPREASSRPAVIPLHPASAADLTILQQQVAGCTACAELAATRTQTVFGVGDPQARLCFMGEAPGADEDRTGEPFVGPAGQLLTKMIEACTLSRTEVYILNTLKCRPPGNRNPKPEESDNCRGFLTRQLELIDPEYIVCLGAVAAQNFLGTTTPIGRLRGTIHQHAGRKVICTYHPAYLLRNPSAKKPAWDDLQLLMAELGLKRTP